MSATSQKTESSNLSAFIGQEKIIADIRRRIDLALNQKQTFANIMLNAPPEMGKKALAMAIANELSANIKVIDSTIKKVGDFASLITQLKDGDILLVEEIGLLNPVIKEAVKTAIEDSALEVMLGKGRSARKLKLKLPYFITIGTTSKLWQVDESLRRWFVAYDFTLYSDIEIGKILAKLGSERSIQLTPEVALALTPYCNGGPGIADVLIKRISHLTSAAPSQSFSAEDTLNYLGLSRNFCQSTNAVEKLTHMSGIEFEQWVADYCRRQGYDVQMTEVTGDHGIDLILRRYGELVGAVQCKRWNDPIGEPVVRDFYGALMSIGASRGYIFATTSFTPHAIAFAHSKPIELINLDSLAKVATKQR